MFEWNSCKWRHLHTALGLVHSLDHNYCRLWWMRSSTALLRQPHALVHSQTLHWQCLVPLQSSSHFTHCDNIASSLFTKRVNMYANETDISLCMWDTLKHYNLSNVVKVWAGYHMLYKKYLKYLWWHFDSFAFVLWGGIFWQLRHYNSYRQLLPT